MEFLYRLYSNDYFGIGLFIVITILAFSFLVILFFGKKDEKARNTEINKEKNTTETVTNPVDNKENTVEEVELQPDSIGQLDSVIEGLAPASDAPVEENEKEQESNPIDPFAVPENLISTPELPDEQPENEVVLPQEGKEENVSEIEQNSSPFEMDGGEVSDQEAEKTEEESAIPSNINLEPFHIEAPVIEEPVPNDIFAEPSNEEPKKPTLPPQFSSVYLNNSNNKPKENIEKETDKKVEAEEVAPMPVKPDFELPKTLDLPKLNKNSNASSNDIIKSSDSSKTITNIFDKLEEDTYTIDK